MTCGKQAHETPGQRGFIEQGFGRNFISAQYHAIELPHEAARQLHINRCSNAATAEVVVLWIFSQSQFEPLGDTVALHQSDFVFQGGQRIAPHLC